MVNLTKTADTEPCPLCRHDLAAHGELKDPDRWQWPWQAWSDTRCRAHLCNCGCYARHRTEWDRFDPAWADELDRRRKPGYRRKYADCKRCGHPPVDHCLSGPPVIAGFTDDDQCDNCVPCRRR
jgi:hypothetical protein